jgi:two-component system, chemotaxis family, response regulator Rcp1
MDVTSWQDQAREAKERAELTSCIERQLCTTVQEMHPGSELEGTMTEILLAEDNPADVYLIREALREHEVDATIRVASDGREVLQLICPEKDVAVPRLDLIILDLNLPRHDGIEILERLRGSAQLASVPVVVLTSSDSPRDQKVANQLGATCYLHKPSNLEEFLALGGVLKRLLNGGYANSVGK